MSILKSIYQLIPSDIIFAFAKFIRLFGTPPLSVRQKLLFDKTFRISVSKGRSFKMRYTGKWIESDLFWKGIQGYEKASIEVWMKAAASSRTIIDIGANTGVFSLAAKAINNKAKVIAFEPLPWALELLNQNVKINGFDIEVIPKAVSDSIGVASFYFPKENQGNIYSSTLSIDHYLSHSNILSNKIDVQLVSVDLYCEENAIKSLDLVKVDAEGNDHAVIRGMLHTIQKFEPAILVEIQDQAIASEIQSILPKQYYYFALDDEKGPISQKSIVPGNALNYFLCPEKRLKEFGLIY